jgi:AcrR family transcriptional regulator
MPPRRPSQARDRLVEAALQLFYQEGINRVGVEQIIKTAGVARMTFYRHFPSKTDLIEAVLQERSEQLWDWLVGETSASTSDPYERLLTIFDKLESYLSAPGFRGCIALNFASDMADTAPGVTEIARQHKEAVRQYVEENARAAGMDDPEGLSHSLMLLMNGALSLGQIQKSAEPARRARQAATTLLASAAPSQARQGVA